MPSLPAQIYFYIILKSPYIIKVIQQLHIVFSFPHHTWNNFVKKNGFNCYQIIKFKIISVCKCVREKICKEMPCVYYIGNVPYQH